MTMERRGCGLFDPLKTTVWVTLKNRMAKSAMSDSLGDGTGHPTTQQVRLYQLPVSIIGEVQSTGDFAEKPGNLVLKRQDI